MNDQDASERRVRFYGAGDIATYMMLSRAAELAGKFDPSSMPLDMTGVLELFNVQKYLENEILPDSYTQEERDQVLRKLPQIRSAVSRHFSSIKGADLAEKLADIDHEYLADLVDLLGRNKVFERCDGAIVLPALRAAGVHLDQMLASRKLVHAYDAQLRDALLAWPRAAEYLVRKYLQRDAHEEIFLPLSFTPSDSHALLERYIDSDDAHLNYVELISTSKDNLAAGIDTKLRLRAKRRHAGLVAQLFDKTAGLRTGYEVQLSRAQSEPVKFETDRSDGLVTRYTYGRSWLESTLEYPSILNNFQHLFEFSDRRVLLTLPSYAANIGTVAGLVGIHGKDEYKVGAVFRTADSVSLLQTQMYLNFLRYSEVELEEVISWYFGTHLPESFGVEGFSFAPSGHGTPYLQKVRHLFAEMESIANQFTLFARDGELDRDLLAMGSEQVRYREVPSLLEGKYLYPSGSEEMARILHLLFSDQSRLTYISEDLRARSLVGLLIENHVKYADFHEHQQASVDYLMSVGIVEDVDDRVQFASLPRLSVLKALHETEADSYFHLSKSERAEADDMLEKGWITRRSSLLTGAEGAYFNYFLNGVDFSNGPALRNKYLHGSQANATDEVHYETYIIALRLTVALVIKMNDDFCLWAAENGHPDDSEP